MFLQRAASTCRSAVQAIQRNYSKMPPPIPAEGPIKMAITRVLSSQLLPLHLEVINESFMHNVPPGSETHFKVVVVSEQFDNVPLIKRHRLVNALVKNELQGQFVHALSIDAKSPAQWTPDTTTFPTPTCKGGFGK